MRHLVTRRTAHHHIVFHYPTSFRDRVFALILAPFGIFALMYLATYLYPAVAPTGGDTISLSTVLVAALHTLVRLIIAYLFAVAIAVPLAILVTINDLTEELLLPVFDVLQSIPVLVLFPVIIMVFIQSGFLEGAAIFILFLTMVWNIVFTLVGGLSIIPHDIFAAAQVFGVRGFPFYRRVLLPALVPQLVTGSIVAISAGWNLIIVAEVLHTYIPHGTSAQDLFGLGSILVMAVSTSQSHTFLLTVFVMVGIIALGNFFIWQKLLHFAQRFRFD